MNIGKAHAEFVDKYPKNTVPIAKNIPLHINQLIQPTDYTRKVDE